MKATPIRLALREEGAWINVYLAESGTMEGAILVATLRSSVAHMDGAHEAFQALCCELARIICETSLGPGALAGVEIQPAPENERSGNG
jgi:hypothetical protein